MTKMCPVTLKWLLYCFYSFICHLQVVSHGNIAYIIQSDRGGEFLQRSSEYYINSPPIAMNRRTTKTIIGTTNLNETRRFYAKNRYQDRQNK